MSFCLLFRVFDVANIIDYRWDVEYVGLVHYLSA